MNTEMSMIMTFLGFHFPEQLNKSRFDTWIPPISSNFIYYENSSSIHFVSRSFTKSVINWKIVQKKNRPRNLNHLFCSTHIKYWIWKNWTMYYRWRGTGVSWLSSLRYWCKSDDERSNRSYTHLKWRKLMTGISGPFDFSMCLRRIQERDG